MSDFQQKALKHLGLDSTNPNFSISDSDIYDLSNIQAGHDICQKEYEEKLRWIPVEEKLPEISKESDIYSDVVTVKEHDYYSPLAALYSHEYKQWISYPNSVVLSNVTEWRSFL